MHKILKQLYTALTCILCCSTLSSIAQSHLMEDSITVAIEPQYNQVGKTQRFLFGENYRPLWSTPVKMRVFHISQEKGGLKILQLGGGMQTKSLRLEDPNGKEWVLRTIQKYPDKVLPATLRPTIAAAIVQDQISAEHPFAAITVPPMAEALGIPHAHPQIVYVPDDPALGEYRKDFANQVFLFEEREPLDVKKTDNVPKVQTKLETDNDTRVDQKLVLRARLLDMLLGDWDRHEDQWRFEKQKDSAGNDTYLPVPRDRDQVYNNAYGVAPWLVSRYLLMAKFQSYGKHIRSINRWNLNARNFDRYFLNGLNENDWKEEIAYVQNKLTDQVIADAIKHMPDTIYKQSGPEIIGKLIARRNILNKQGMEYYRFLSQVVTIRASAKRENIDITNQTDGKITVKINGLKKKGKLDQLIYERTFDPEVTNEIRIYGMGGKDIFAVHGTNNLPITVRMIGSDDEDTYAIDSTISGKGGRYIYDRSDQKNSLPSSSQAHLRTSTDTAVNKYDRVDYKYDYLLPLPLATYSDDYGFQLIANFTYQKQGFRKDPYASKQSLTVSYGFGVSSLLLNYVGDFKKVVANNDLVVDVLSKGPNYNSNFFGVGNNSVFVNKGSENIHYYRDVYNFIDADIRLKHVYDKKWTVSAGVTAQYYNGDDDDNQDKYLNVYNQQHPDQKVFSTQTYAGLVAGVVLDTRDKGFLPHNGVNWTTSITGMKQLNASDHDYGQIQSEFSFYINPGKDSVFVIANRTGGGTTLGGAGFYQQLRLGGNQNLRGFYIGRFTGKTMAYNDFELRLKLFDFASYLLPGTLGIIGFNDVGRVWSPGESSNQWHDGYGGGLYFLPAQLFMVQVVVGASKEGVYPYIGAGFKF
jgi:hypothetical protein